MRRLSPRVSGRFFSPLSSPSSSTARAAGSFIGSGADGGFPLWGLVFVAGLACAKESASSIDAGAGGSGPGGAGQTEPGQTAGQGNGGRGGSGASLDAAVAMPSDAAGGTSGSSPLIDAATSADGEVMPNGGLGPAGFVCPPGKTYGNPLPAMAKATTIHTGFREAEGPVWIPAHKILLVSDIDENNLPNGKILKFTPATNLWETFVDPVGTNGMALDVDGRVVAASHDLHSVTRFDPLTAKRTPVAGGDMYMGHPFNEVNDVVVRGDGNIYLTDPLLQPASKGHLDQDATAYYRLSPQGALTRIAAAEQPNGIALSPDGHWLYVSGSFPLRKHAVDAAGAVDPAFTVVADIGSDGMGIDCAGNIYVTTGNGVTVMDANGQTIGSIAVPSSGFMTNVAFGGDDRQTLFITTRYAVHQIHVNVPGFPN